MFWDEISVHLTSATGVPFEARQRVAVGGGCINEAWRVSDGRRTFFIKVNQPTRVEMFEAEAEGLGAIAATDTLRVPNPVTWGIAGGRAFLALEHLDLVGRGDLERLGQQLAVMHRTTRDTFGWHRDNTIGTTLQPNEESCDWIEFLCEQRLGHQLDLAMKEGYRGRLKRLGEELLDRFADLFTDYRPQPSLLHGDLWSGNCAFSRDGTPVVFDPAVYFGDREADLAMTELFGGFAPRFYAAYQEAWPLDPGYPVRRDLYNLYHVLNHLNLFGGGYADQAEDMMERLLAELR